MFGFFRARITSQLNTVNLGEVLDGVEIVQAIEEACDIQFQDSETETIMTVGELYDLLSQKLEHKTEIDPVWLLVCKIVREQSGSKDPIDRDTTFFSKHAKARTKAD